MMTGRLGIKTNEGIVSLELDAANPEDSQVSINMLDDFGMAVPAFAQSTPVTAVSVGELKVIELWKHFLAQAIEKGVPYAVFGEILEQENRYVMVNGDIINNKITSMAICQDCGYSWRV